MTPAQLETVYEAMARALDTTDDAPEILLAKLCLALAHYVPDPAVVLAEIEKLTVHSHR